MNFNRIIKRISLVIILVIFLPIITAMILLPFYKDEIKASIIEYIKDGYGLDVNAGNVGVSVIADWPNATIETPILEAASIDFSFDILKLIRKQMKLKYISIYNSKINIIKDVNGESNCLIKSRQKKGAKSMLEFDIKKVKIVNVLFNYTNHQQNKHIEVRLVSNALSVKKNFINYSATLSGRVLISELLFKPKKGPFLKNARADININMTYYPDLKTMFVGSNSTIQMENQSFIINACLDAKNEKLALRFIGTNLNYERTLRLLNNNIRTRLREINVTKGLDANALLVVSLNKEEDPEMFIKIKTKNNSVFVGDSKVPFSDVNFDMKIVCFKGNDKEPELSKAKIIIDSLQGKIYNVPFTGNGEIENFVDPRLRINCKLRGDGQQINNSTPIDIQLIGILEADVYYSGAMKYVNRNDFLGDSTNLNAKLTFKNITYQPDGSFPLKLNGKATINNDTLKCKAIRINTNGGDFLVSGTALDFADYICGVSKGFRANLRASSNSFDLSPFLLAKHDITKKVSKPNLGRKVKLIKQTDFEFKIQLQIKNSIVRKVKGTNVNADLHYQNDDLEIKDLSFNLEKGRFALKGKMENFSTMKAEVSVKNADVNLLFDQFENFGQTGIKAENLQGTIDVDAKLGLKLTPQFEFEKNSAYGNINVRLKDGHLLDYEPLQNVSNFIFRKRNFKDIIFTEIQETLILEGDKIRLSNLELASNVINLYVDGVYSFKGISNFNVRIPWSNFKSRKKDFIPINMGEEGSKAKAIKLNINGYPKQMKISLGAKEEE